MTYDTLQYVDGGGATQEIALALQNLATKGGAVSLVFNPASHAPGTFQITWAQPPETGIAIPFKSRCKVFANRTSADGSPNSFSGGTILFQGRRTDNQGSANGRHVSTAITLSDAWWDLQHITYTIPWQYITGGTLASPVYSTFNWPDIVLFQAAPGTTYNPAAVNGTITTWQQLQAIIAFAASYASGTDAVQLQLAGSGALTGSVWSAGSGAEFQPVYCNWYPLRSAKCGEAINVCLRPHPGVFTEIDHSTTPPTLHFRNRAAMVSVTLPYKSTDVNGITHLASQIEPLNHLVPDNVRLFYKINGTYNGQPVVNYSEDSYPDAGNHLLSQDYSIDVTGATTTQTSINFSSSNFDPTSLALWRERVVSLKDDAHGGQIPASGTGALAFVDSAAYNSGTHPKGIQVIGDDGTDYSANYGSVIPYLTDQDIYGWFNLSGGGTVKAVRATIKAFFTYNKTTAMGGGTLTDSFGEHQHSFRVLLTNVPSGQQILRQTLNTGESIPANLAQYIYTELATLQWKLRHEVIQVAADSASVPTLIKPGLHKINLSGGDTAWTTMNAVAENVTIKFFRTGDNRLGAQHSISCGPVNHLEPGYLIQLTNLFCNRNRSGIDANQRLTGISGSSQVDLSSTAPKENSLPSEPVPIATNHAYVSGGAIAGQTVQSAQLVADVLGATTPTPVGTSAGMKTQQPREMAVCDNAGNFFYAIVQATEGHTKP